MEGDENLGQKNRFTKYGVIACNLDFLVYRKYTLTLLWDEKCYLWKDRMPHNKIMKFCQNNWSLMYNVYAALHLLHTFLGPETRLETKRIFSGEMSSRNLSF